MAEALVNRRVLRWARERADLSVDTLAKKVGIKPQNIHAWEAEEGKLPTFHQAQKVAEATHVPFGYLFLEEPPQEPLGIPDLRTLGGGLPEPFNADTRDLLSDIQYKHDWFKDYLVEHGAERLPFVGRFDLADRPIDIAQDIRATLRFEQLADQSPNWGEHLRQLMIRAEDAGIWVMRSGIVGSNTHRPLLVSQFRGFAIADEIAPLVFINGKDATAAQIFTLAHELAHIWIGQSGISNVQVTMPPEQNERIEIVCNAVAAETLAPSALVRQLWDRQASLENNAAALSARLKVSRIVVARRGLELRFIDANAYRNFANAEQARWQADAESASSGGNHYLTQAVRYGRRFVRAVATDAARGDLLLREAGKLLNTKPATVLKTYKLSLEP